MTLMLDLAAQQGGFEKPQDGLGAKKCPKCGGNTFAGFGLMGGGMGPYVACDGIGEAKACDWFYKEQSKSE